MPRDLKMSINADLLEVGDKVVHPLDLKVRKVKSIKKSLAHADHLDFDFDGGHALSMWKTTHVTVIRPVQTLHK